jgi:alkylation response protein AidB-like acyl-CoA dehydrogenase
VDLEFTEDQESLRDSIRTFLEKESPLSVARSVVETGEPATSLWESMVALDWPALTIPEDNGGIGLSSVEAAVLAEEVGRVVAPGPLLATVTQFVPMIREVGTREQRQHFLSQVVTGQITGTVALADHPRRWSVHEVTMVAEPADGGWTLSGTKRAILASPESDEIAVVARVGTGLGGFVVPAAEAGLTAVLSLDASRPLFDATLDNVFVSGDRSLGQPGSEATTAAVIRAVEEATVAMALETLGTADALFQLSLAYVKDRHQFGVPIGSFQAIKHKMADMYMVLERARALCYFAVAAVEEDADQRSTAVAMAKAASDDCQKLVCREAFQTFGGIGFTWEHDSHIFIKRAQTTALLFGGSTTHTATLAQGLGVTSAV